MPVGQSLEAPIYERKAAPHSRLAVEYLPDREDLRGITRGLPRSCVILRRELLNCELWAVRAAPSKLLDGGGHAGHREARSRAPR